MMMMITITTDPSGVASLPDDWREKLAANLHKATETDPPPSPPPSPISREEWVDNNNKITITKILLRHNYESVALHK